MRLSGDDPLDLRPRINPYLALPCPSYAAAIEVLSKAREHDLEAHLEEAEDGLPVVMVRWVGEEQ